MAPAAGEQREPFFEVPGFEGIGALLAPFPGRLEFALRMALICALTTLVAEFYQTPDPALTVYVVFFVMKPDRASSVVTSVAMLLLITLILGLVLALAVEVIEQPRWRVTAMTLVSFCVTFAASASKLKPVAGTVALIVAYALDLLGSVPGGELATRGILYVWLFVGIPAGVCIVVNLVLGPSPRCLAERALAHRLRLAAAVVRAPEMGVRKAFEECLHEGPGEIPAWLKLAGAERTSPAQDIASLQQAARSTIVILSVVDFLTSDAGISLPVSISRRIAATLDGMAAILGSGGYPVEIALESDEDEAGLTPVAATALAELHTALSVFAEPPAQEPSPQPAPKPKGGFFLPDAFTNPAHIQYALKTTGAAMFCYLAYLLLDWPGIHTCLITCYIVSLGTTAETMEKQALRFLGCGIGAAAGIAAIVFLMPGVTSIGGLMGVVFLAILASGWIAAGGPRISYVGFQLAFAFLLSVVQGAAPAFDMTIARDRTIGILFGDLVVAIVFTQIWPLTIAERIDPAIKGLLRQVAALTAAASAPKRWGIAAEARASLAAVEQDLDLVRYEPRSIRPAPAWLDERRELASILSSLQGPLLVGADQEPTGFVGTALRLERLAESLDAAAKPKAPASETGVASGASEPMPRQAGPSGISAAVEAPLAKLEQIVANLSEYAAQEMADHAPA
ncbi:MAG: multidrug resistance protein MdtO [Acetobacteraceae bacterium]|nr:multidrug resistance protein MdtO [Acetobacteraceae bacterium]